ncbi:hypothetical protein [Ruegeria sp.]|uniref:hypothetical protein n=1 Tax=Ruegeria sp. TaxID=1879320 RepID=UPI003AFF7472
MSDTPKAKRTYRTQTPEEKQADLDAELSRVRKREELRLITAADKAGYFRFRLSNKQLADMFNATIDTLKPKHSTLAGLHSKKARLNARQRKDDGRRKAILGGFLVAQCRHKPDLHAAIVEDIRAFLSDHPTKTVARRNLDLLEGFLADPEAHDTGTIQGEDTQSVPRAEHRVRAHRLILLGSWVLDRRAERDDLARLIAQELAGFLDQGAHPERHRTLLKEMLDGDEPDQPAT